MFYEAHNPLSAVLFSVKVGVRTIFETSDIYNFPFSTRNQKSQNRTYSIKKVVKAISTDWKELIKKREIYVIDNNCYVNTNGDKTELQNMNQKSIYKALVIKKLDRSAAYKKYTVTYDLDEFEWKTIYLMPHTLPISSKAKEIHY